MQQSPSPVLAVQGRAAHLNCRQPFIIYMCVWWGAQRSCLSSPCTGHENRVYGSPQPSDCEGTLPQADSAGSAQPHPVPPAGAWGEPTETGAEEQAAGSPASSQPEQRSQ